MIFRRKCQKRRQTGVFFLYSNSICNFFRGVNNYQELIYTLRWSLLYQFSIVQFTNRSFARKYDVDFFFLVLACGRTTIKIVAI